MFSWKSVGIVRLLMLLLSLLVDEIPEEVSRIGNATSNILLLVTSFIMDWRITRKPRGETETPATCTFCCCFVFLGVLSLLLLLVE